MSIKEKKNCCKNALIRSAVLSLAIFFLMIYLLWRGPPIETFLVRHMYLRKEFIYYLVCVFFAVFLLGLHLIIYEVLRVMNMTRMMKAKNFI